MLDIVQENPVKEISHGLEYTHNNISDLSLYEERCKIKLIPVDALTSLTDRTVNGEPIREIVEPRRLEGFSALYNTATDQLLPTRPVGSTYKLVDHLGLFHDQNIALLESDLPIGDVTVIDRLFEGGLRAHRTVIFNELQSPIEHGRDLVRCRMDLFNSVDQSWSFQVFSGAYRDLCRNTLVFGGEKAYHQKRKHTSGLDTDALLSNAKMGLEFWTNNRDQMMAWRDRSCTINQFSDILAATICKKNTETAKTGHGSQVNEKLMSYLLHRFKDERRELNNTLWTAYNALTHWSTHTDQTWIGDDGKERKTSTKGAKAFNVERDREAAIRGILTSPEWTALELGGNA